MSLGVAPKAFVAPRFRLPWIEQLTYPMWLIPPWQSSCSPVSVRSRDPSPSVTSVDTTSGWRMSIIASRRERKKSGVLKSQSPRKQLQLNWNSRETASNIQAENLAFMRVGGHLHGRRDRVKRLRSVGTQCRRMRPCDDRIGYLSW